MREMRCVLDTNVLISAVLLKNSLPFQVVERIVATSKLLLSEATQSELEEVLGRSKFDKYITWEERQVFLASLLMNSDLVKIRETIDICRDPKDNKFLELAVNGNANFIVTGDSDLLVLHPFKNIEILTPKDFLSRFDLEDS